MHLIITLCKWFLLFTNLVSAVVELSDSWMQTVHFAYMRYTAANSVWRWHHIRYRIRLGAWTWIYANLFPLIFLLIHLMYACNYFLYLFVVCYANLTLTDLEFDLFVYSCVLRMEMHFQHWSNWQHFPSPWDVNIFVSQRWLFLESNIIYMKSKLDDHCGCWQSLEKFCWHRLCMFILHTLLCIMWTKLNEQRLLNAFCMGAYSGRGSMKMSS